MANVFCSGLKADIKCIEHYDGTRLYKQNSEQFKRV